MGRMGLLTQDLIQLTATIKQLAEVRYAVCQYGVKVKHSSQTNYSGGANIVQLL